MKYKHSCLEVRILSDGINRIRGQSIHDILMVEELFNGVGGKEFIIARDFHFQHGINDGAEQKNAEYALRIGHVFPGFDQNG